MNANTTPTLTEYRVHFTKINPNTGERVHGFSIREDNARQGREARGEHAEDYIVEKVRKAPRPRA